MKPGFSTPALPLLVFTDLDGTLLDHDSYSFQAALPALQRLHSLRVPVIPVTSKTLAELEPLSMQLGLHGPCIVENGALVACPAGFFSNDPGDPAAAPFQIQRLSPDYEQIVRILEKVRDDFGFPFEHFGELTVDRVCALTGLSREQALLAKKRLGSAPLLWHGTDQEMGRFAGQLRRHLCNLTRGGRFWHVMGQTDKAFAIRRLIRRFEDLGFSGFETIALGDSPNDIPMLMSADMAVVIRRKDGSYLDLERTEKVVRTQGSGPEGWNEFFQAYLGSREAEPALRRSTRRH